MSEKQFSIIIDGVIKCFLFYINQDLYPPVFMNFLLIVHCLFLCYRCMMCVFFLSNSFCFPVSEGIAFNMFSAEIAN